MFPIPGRKSAVNVQFCSQGRGVWFTAQYHISTSQALLRENQVGIEKFWLLSKCQTHNGSTRLLCAERGAKMSNLRLLHFSPFQQIIQDFHPRPHPDINLISKAVLAWRCQLMPRYSSSHRYISKSEQKAIVAFGLHCKGLVEMPSFKNALGTANQFANGLNRSLGRAHINGLWKVNSREWNKCFWQPQ